jgi:excisionase family DNA binding protein
MAGRGNDRARRGTARHRPVRILGGGARRLGGSTMSRARRAVPCSRSGAPSDEYPEQGRADGKSMNDRQLYRVPEAMVLLSLSRSVLYEELRNGRLRSVHVGRTRLIPATAIAEYVALLEREADALQDVS